MSGVAIAQILAYLASVLFLVGMARRVAKHARAQIALRWELYPVPHEVGKEHGGSYFEDQDWWEEPRRTNQFGQLKIMIPEILLLTALWEHRRKLWLPAYPFPPRIFASLPLPFPLLGG